MKIYIAKTSFASVSSSWFGCGKVLLAIHWLVMLNVLSQRPTQMHSIKRYKMQPLLDMKIYTEW